MKDIIKNYLFLIYKFIVDFFNIKKFKAYRQFVKFMTHCENNPDLVTFWSIIIVLQFGLWHWVYDFNLFDDIMTMGIAYLLYKAVFSKIKL